MIPVAGCLEEHITKLILPAQGRFCSQFLPKHTEKVASSNCLECFFQLCIHCLNILEVLQDALLLQAASSSSSEALCKDFRDPDHFIAVRIPKPSLTIHPVVESS